MTSIKINARKGTKTRRVVDKCIELYKLDVKSGDMESICFGFSDATEFHKSFYVDTNFIGSVHYYESDKILCLGIYCNDKILYQISIIK